MTVIDPLGSPSNVFNRSGVAIVPLSPSGSSAPGTTETYVTGHEVLVCHATSGNQHITLSGDHEVGDVIEVCNSGTVTLTVNMADGESVIGDGSATGASTGKSFYLRKIDTSTWARIG